MSAEGALIKARSQLLMDQPFFGTLAIRLRPVRKDDIKTAATDGSHFFYNEAFVSKLDPVQLRGLIAHEVMHCVFNHMTRRQERDHSLWNVACDYAINDHLIQSGFILPKGGLHDPAYKDMSAEAIYNQLKKDPKKHKPCAWGIVLDASSGDLEAGSSAEMESQWQIAVGEAASVAKARGKMPGSLEHVVAEVMSPKVDWRTVLWPFFTDLVNDDFSWRKPNRAYISEDEYLPSMHEEACGKVAVMLDTSGSISDEQGKLFISETAAVLAQVQPEQVIYVQCDDGVQSVKVLERGQRLTDDDLRFKGRSGTSFAPAFKHLAEHHPDVEAIVYLTDLETSEDDFAQVEKLATAPVLWVSVNRHREAPFGTTVYLPD
jgi:predicted metal-dependent peptidase